MEQDRYDSITKDGCTFGQIQCHIFQSHRINASFTLGKLIFHLILILKYVVLCCIAIVKFLRPFGVIAMGSEANFGVAECHQILPSRGGDHADVCLLAQGQ